MHNLPLLLLPMLQAKLHQPIQSTVFGTHTHSHLPWRHARRNPRLQCRGARQPLQLQRSYTPSPYIPEQ